MNGEAKGSSVLAAHEKDVERVVAKMKEFYANKTHFRVQHGISHTTRSVKKDPKKVIDVSSMNRILSFEPADAAHPTRVKVEPNVSMGQIVDACLAKGVIPPVIVEIPEVTMGGGFCGTSGETSSFRKGLFYENVNSIDVVLANGTFKSVDKKDDADIFYGFANSYGTMGIVTMLELDLIKAEDYVILQYELVASVQDACDKFQKAKDETPPTTDFIEGVMFGKNKGVVARGVYASSEKIKGLPLATFTNKPDPWYYLHMQEYGLPKRDEPYRFAVPLRDYLFRYDRGGFWMGKYGYDYFLVPFNKTTRKLLDRFMRTHVAMKAFQSSGLNDQYVVQDMTIPTWNAGEFMEWLDKRWSQYPILLWPISNINRPPLFAKMVPLTMMGVNFGVYGPGPKDAKEFLQFNRDLEHELNQNYGLKGMYAQVFCDEQQWNERYDMEEYRRVREMCDANWLPDVYQKFASGSFSGTKFRSFWPLPGLYGVYNIAKPKLKQKLGRK